ncbi:MAG: 4-hydroxy-tetrahydrodipicolinate reductase [Acidimicrobiales bacterium]
MRVGVLGAGGRMGREVCRAVDGAGDLDLVAAVDPANAGAYLDQVAGVGAGITVGGDLSALADAGAEAVVDFTVAGAATANMRWCADHGVHAVVGTTGIDDATQAELAGLFEGAAANCIVAANFAIGAVLMMRFAEIAAPFMDAVEIIELHHDAKRDAPSGTALSTAARIAAARRHASSGPWPADPTSTEVVAGTRGGVADGVHVHSVRMAGLVAHQEVIFGARGQSLTIRHDAYDRSSFMPGVLLALHAVAQRPGLTVGLDALLGA